jgi:hypothetical protein
VACRAARDRNALGCYLGCTQGREPEPGWAGLASIQVLAHGQFIFQIFSKFQTNLNLNQIYNFDDFHSHNKI